MKIFTKKRAMKPKRYFSLKSRDSKGSMTNLRILLVMMPTPVLLNFTGKYITEKKFVDAEDYINNSP